MTRGDVRRRVRLVGAGAAGVLGGAALAVLSAYVELRDMLWLLVVGTGLYMTRWSWPLLLLLALRADDRCHPSSDERLPRASLAQQVDGPTAEGAFWGMAAGAAFGWVLVALQLGREEGPSLFFMLVGANVLVLAATVLGAVLGKANCYREDLRAVWRVRAAVLTLVPAVYAWRLLTRHFEPGEILWLVIGYTGFLMLRYSLPLALILLFHALKVEPRIAGRRETEEPVVRRWQPVQWQFGWTTAEAGLWGFAVGVALNWLVIALLFDRAEELLVYFLLLLANPLAAATTVLGAWAGYRLERAMERERPS